MYSSNDFIGYIYEPFHDDFWRNSMFDPMNLPYSMMPYPIPYVHGWQNAIDWKNFIPPSINPTFFSNPYMNYFQQQWPMPFQPPSPFHMIMNSFKNKDGTIDLNKLIQTTGQMVNVFSQISSVVKGLGPLFK